MEQKTINTSLALQIAYQCGCGFSTPHSGNAGAHVRETGHTLTVHGVVRPSKSTLEALKGKVAA